MVVFFARRDAGAGSSSNRSSTEAFFALRGAGASSSSNPQSSLVGLRAAEREGFAGSAGASSHSPRPSRSSVAAADFVLGSSAVSSGSARAGRRRVDRTWTSGSLSSTAGFRERRVGLGSSSQSSSFEGSSSQSSSRWEGRKGPTLALLLGHLLLVADVHLGELLTHVVQRQQMAQ